MGKRLWAPQAMKRLSELHAAVIREQLKKLASLNNIRLEMVQQLNDGLNKFKFFTITSGRELCESSYYVYPLRYNKEETGILREDFVAAVNAEGIQFYQGYVKPLYLQPVYQKKDLFKKGYPFLAPPNKDCKMEYHKGLCPNTEKLHFREMIINEHIRPPQTSSDIANIISAVDKIINY